MPGRSIKCVCQVPAGHRHDCWYLFIWFWKISDLGMNQAGFENVRTYAVLVQVVTNLPLGKLFFLKFKYLKNNTKHDAINHVKPCKTM